MLNALKTDLTQLIHLSRDALHVHFGLLIFLLAMVALRKSPASGVPWLCVLGVELVNEALDLMHGHGGLRSTVLGALKDIVNTMFWPTIILLLARYTGVLRRPRR
ncbi:MAG TPA: hypothetical protein VGN80_04240 [Devosiaceae bacterium]|nr:hypothetical protein [Devosiaceae bacterium]